MSALATTARAASREAERPAPAPASHAGAPAGLPRFAEAPPVVQAKCATCAAEEERARAGDAVQHRCAACGAQGSVQAKCAACEDETRVQHACEACGGGSATPVHALARQGVAGADAPLPFLDRIQDSFGRHDVRHTRARVGGAAGESSARMGALAYTVGTRVGFRDAPDVRLAAHEAAHVVQQRAGVHLAGGVGRPGDVYERQADAVADAVARGVSAEPILDRVAPPAAPARDAGAGGAPVQHRLAVTATRRFEPLPPPAALPTGGVPRAAGRGGGRAKAAVPASGAAAATVEGDGGEPATTEAGTEAGGGGAAGGGTEARSEGQAEPACPGAGTLNAVRYRADVEEPEEEPEEEPPEPEATEAEEEVDSESPDAEEVDDCPIETAVEAAAPEGASGPAATPEGAAAAQAGGGGPAGETASTPAEPGEAAEAATPEAGGARAARAGAEGGGGGAVGGEATDESAAGATTGPLESSIHDTEVARSEAVAAYLGSTEALGTAAAGLPGLTDDVTFADEAPSAEAGARQRVARTRARGFFGEAAGLVEGALVFAREQVPGRLGGLAETFKGMLDVSVETQKAAISARIELARGQAREQAGNARARVVGAHAAAVARIDAETEAALSAVTDAYLDAQAAIDEREPQALDDVNALYADSRQAHEDLGPLIGGEAVARGEEYVAAYEKFKIHERDSLTAGYLTDRRAEAQQNAARKTAEGYSTSMVKTAKKQARVATQGRKKDRCGVIATARRARDVADQQLDALTGALEGARTQAVSQADATRDAMLAAIAATLATTLGDLDRQEHEQRQAASDVGYLQQVVLEQVAHAAAASVQNAVAQGARMVVDVLGQVRTTFAASPAPDAEALDGVLGQAASALRGGLGRLRDQAQGGLTTAEGSVASAATRAFGALEGVTRANDEQTTGRLESAGQALGQVAAGAVQALAQQAEGHATRAQQWGADGAAALAGVATGFDLTCTAITDQILVALLDSESRLEQSLRDSLASIDCEIPKHAQEAASKEQPAWKSIVKWVLIIAIVIVVAVVVGPAVIGAVGAAAASLGAGAAAAGAIGTVVGGAIVGAATSATIQVVSNVAEGRTWYQGVGRAAIMGAIGGAFGAGAGALIGRATTSVALQFAGNVAADAVLEVGTQLVTGEFSLSALGMSVLMSAVTGGFGEVRGLKNVQQRWMVRGAGGVPGARARAYADTLRPPAPGARPEPGATRPVEEAAPAPRAEEGPARVAEAEAARVPRGEAEPPPSGRAERGAPRPPTEVEAEGARVAREPARTGPGRAPRLEAEPDVPATRRTEGELAEAAAPARIGEQPHSVAPRRWGGETKLVVCSPDCGPLTAKIESIQGDAPPALRKELDALHDDVKTLEARIAAGQVDSLTIVRETNRIASALSDIGTRHPHLGERLNAVQGEGDAEVRARHAGDWAVNPATGSFDGRRRLQGLTADEVDTRAQGRERPGEPDPVRRRRRHLAEHAGEEPMGMREWAESGFRANVNRDVSSPMERGALGQVGATPNRPVGPDLTYKYEYEYKETVDASGRPVPRSSPRFDYEKTVKARPDGTRPNTRGGTDIVEHKHLTGDADVLYDSPQLRAEREYAESLNGDHELIISSDRALAAPSGRRGGAVPQVQPSGPLGEATKRIYYYDPGTGRITHEWRGGRWIEV